MSEFHKITLHENVSNALVEDLTKIYGLPWIINKDTPYVRWFFKQNSIYFADKKDHLLFLIKYS